MIKKLIPILFLIYLCLSITAQVRINGVYKYNKYPAESGFNKFYQYDFNQDNKLDLLLIGKDDKKAVWFEINSNGDVSNVISKFFFYPISTLEQFKKIEGSGQTHLFTSRKERMVGLVSFTKYGTIQLLNEIRFNSYPSGIVSGDFDNDNQTDALVFGSAFEGISLINEKSFKLSSRSIIPEGVFSELTSVDLNFDGAKDIIAFNNLDNTLRFFENIDSGYFDEIRKFELETDISNLSAVYYNNDQYLDLVFNKENNIEILLGDSVYSYYTKHNLETEFEIKNFSIGDFNGDNKNDLVLLSDVGVFISLFNDYGVFTNPIKVDKINNPSALICRDFHSFYYYSADGILFNMQYKDTININSEYKFSENVSSILTLENNRNNILAYIDSAESKFVVINNFDSFAEISEIKLQHSDTEKIYHLSTADKIEFFIQSKGQETIEQFGYDTETKKISKKQIIVKDSILYCFTDENEKSFNVVSLNDSLLNWSSYSFIDDELTFKENEYEYCDTLKSIISASENLIHKTKGDSLLVLNEKRELLLTLNMNELNSFGIDKCGNEFFITNDNLIFKKDKKYIYSGYDFNGFSEQFFKSISRNKFGYLNKDKSKLTIWDFNSDKIKTKEYSVLIAENFILDGFQVIKTLLIFTTTDGTINIQELI